MTPAERQLLEDISEPDDAVVDTLARLRGDLLLLVASDGDFGLSASQEGMGCHAEDVGGVVTMDFDNPAPGQGFFYIVRGVSCDEKVGTYDTSGAGQIRTRDPQLGRSPSATWILLSLEPGPRHAAALSPSRASRPVCRVLARRRA